MSIYTIAFVVVFLCLALFVGFCLGWAIRGDMEAAYIIWANKQGDNAGGAI
jgi:hypothetical protein